MKFLISWYNATQPYCKASVCSKTCVSRWRRYFLLKSYMFSNHSFGSSRHCAFSVSLLWYDIPVFVVKKFFGWRNRNCNRAGMTAWLVDGKRPIDIVTTKILVAFSTNWLRHYSWTFSSLFCGKWQFDV